MTPIALRGAKRLCTPQASSCSSERRWIFRRVTDHAAYLGMLPEMSDPETAAGRHPAGRLIQEATDTAARRAAFQAMGDYFRGNVENDDLLDLDVVRSAWQAIIESAERYNDPGTFTTFIGYEYTASGSERENLHRNVIFRGGEAPDIPFSRLDDTNPEKLWSWMDGLRESGIESLAIPHNSNGSNGMMFELTNWAGDPIDAAYATLRMRNEPLVEITQVKGHLGYSSTALTERRVGGLRDLPLSDRHDPAQPARRRLRARRLSAWPHDRGEHGRQSLPVRPRRRQRHPRVGRLLLRVRLLEQGGQCSTTVTTSGGSTPDGNGEYSDTYYRFWGASGLTGVWAEENTRAAIFDAFRRKETFATTGPRIQVRFFAGYGLESAAAERDVAALYAGGTPMGGDLLASGGQVPVFVAWALRDPMGAPLDRLQIIKGWIDEGKARERVFDVACARGASVDSRDPQMPADRGHRGPDRLPDQCGHRCRRADGHLAGPGLRCRAERLLLPPSPGKPDLPLVHLGCAPGGSAAADRSARYPAGAGLELADLVQILN